MSAAEKLAQRRKALLVRCAVQRADMLADSYLLRHAATPERIGSDMMDAVREHKMAIAGTLLALIVLKPRRIIAGLKTAVVGWQTVRNVLPMLQNFKSLLKRP